MMLVLCAVGTVARGGGSVLETKELETAKAAADGNTRFALELYGKLRAGEGNLFFSPYSVSAAMAMTSAGARGETDKEMAGVLRLPLDAGERHASFGALNRLINGEKRANADVLVSANALWLQKGEPMLGGFLEVTKRDYGASANEVDFQSDPSAARLRINEWVEEQTKKKIRDLLGEGTVDRSTAMVLTNAVYFKGSWVSPFNKEATKKDGVFKARGGEKVTVPLMGQTETLGYLDGGTFQGLELPYAGGERAMVVLLPKEEEGLAKLEGLLSAENLAAWMGKMGRAKVKVELPRFRLEEQFSLGEVLREMGMKRAFDLERADFSGMTGIRDKAISLVIHKAFVDVDEKGTEAAAATAVVMMRASAMIPKEPVVFRADHPFVFLIRDKKTGSILFLGRMVKPKG